MFQLYVALNDGLLAMNTLAYLASFPEIVVDVLKLWSLSLMKRQNKLECLSLIYLFKNLMARPDR